MPHDVLARIEKVIRDTFGDDSLSISRETIAEDVPGWDSLSHTILVLAIEEEFGITLPPGSNTFKDVGELADSVEKQL